MTYVIIITKNLKLCAGLEGFPGVGHSSHSGPFSGCHRCEPAKKTILSHKI